MCPCYLFGVQWLVFSVLRAAAPSCIWLTGGTQLIQLDQHGPHSTLNKRLV